MDLSQPGLQSIHSHASLADSFANARRGYETARMPDAATRRADLNKLGAMLRDNKDAIARAISEDFGNRSLHETELLEIFPALSAIDHAKSHVKSWMKPQRSMASIWFMPATTELRPQPLGVVGIIVPWNYPILLAVSPLVAALAAGNRVLIKMSEFTHVQARCLPNLWRRHFPRIKFASSTVTLRLHANFPLCHSIIFCSPAQPPSAVT
jgi:coniferyl-aldehyde dehydrogenase